MLRRKWSHLPIVKRIIFMQVYVHSFRKFPHINLLFNSVSNCSLSVAQIQPRTVDSSIPENFSTQTTKYAYKMYQDLLTFNIYINSTNNKTTCHRLHCCCIDNAQWLMVLMMVSLFVLIDDWIKTKNC